MSSPDSSVIKGPSPNAEVNTAPIELAANGNACASAIKSNLGVFLHHEVPTASGLIFDTSNCRKMGLAISWYPFGVGPPTSMKGWMQDSSTSDKSKSGSLHKPCLL